MAYSKVTVATETEVKSEDINQISDNIELCSRGAEADHLYAYGSKQTTIPDSSSSGTEQTVAFATDSENGDPGFASAPKVTFGIEVVSGTVIGTINALIKAGTLDEDGFTILSYASTIQTSGDVVINIFWHADGV